MKGIAYFVLGVAFGATLGLLFAPGSGQDLWARIQDTAASLVADDVEEETAVEEAGAIDLMVDAEEED